MTRHNGRLRSQPRTLEILFGRAISIQNLHKPEPESSEPMSVGKRKARRLSVFVGCVVGAAVTPLTTSAQEPLWGGALVTKIDSIAQATLADGLVSGFSIGVRRGDNLLLAQGYGSADLESAVPAGPHTVYRIGSITKQFTAAAVMQLVDRGVIGLDDPLNKFLPDLMLVK